MKKLFFFLFGSMLLCSCNCVLSQIPPQYIYAGGGCTASLPDYRTQVIVSGGCQGYTLEQTPIGGTVLNFINKSVDVTVKAIGGNGKSSQIKFTVTLLDTITPKITPVGLLAEAKTKIMTDLYDAADKVAISIFEDSKKVFDAIPGSLPDTVDYNKVMLITTSIDSAGVRNRLVTYGDSVVVDPQPYVRWEDIIDKPDLMEQLKALPYLPVPEGTTEQIVNIQIPSVGNLWVFDYTLRLMKYYSNGNWKKVVGIN